MPRRRFLVGAARTAAALGILPRLGACRRRTPTAEARPDDVFSALRDRYFVGTLALNPVTSTYLGGDGYSPALRGANATLRNWRPDALRAEGAFYREIERARQGIDPSSLAPADRIDYVVLDSSCIRSRTGACTSAAWIRT